MKRQSRDGAGTMPSLIERLGDSRKLISADRNYHGTWGRPMDDVIWALRMVIGLQTLMVFLICSSFN